MADVFDKLEYRPLGDKTVLFYDHGMFTHFARTLNRWFGRVLYYSPWKTAFPTSNMLLLGEGFPEMERVRDFWGAAKDADLFVFGDVYEADLQEYLRSQGKRVWGAGRGEDLELYRFEAKQLLREIGLPVQPVKLVIGLEKLRAHLKKVEDRYIKISLTRGDMETWHHLDYRLSEPKLDALAASMGPQAAAMEFIVESPVADAVEAGWDGYSIDGNFPSHALLGYEVKDCGLLGAVKPYGEFSESVREVNAKLAPVLRRYRYRNFLSTEIRVTEAGEPFLIDPCCRLASPPSELYEELYSNWGDILWHGAAGEMVNPKPTAKFGVEAIIHSDWAEHHWQPVHIAPKAEQWVKLRNACRIDGVDYIVPQDYQLKEIGAVVGIGDSIEEAVKMCRKNAEAVEGIELKIQLDAIGDALKEIEAGENIGIEFSKEPLPTPEEIAA